MFMHLYTCTYMNMFFWNYAHALFICLLWFIPMYNTRFISPVRLYAQGICAWLAYISALGHIWHIYDGTCCKVSIYLYIYTYPWQCYIPPICVNDFHIPWVISHAHDAVRSKGLRRVHMCFALGIRWLLGAEHRGGLLRQEKLVVEHGSVPLDRHDVDSIPQV